MPRHLPARRVVPLGLHLRRPLHPSVLACERSTAIVTSSADPPLAPPRARSDVCAAFAATLLIRLARIFPTELDLRQTARDVTELAKILSNVPAGRYARSIRLTLRSARRRKVMPPPSLPPSPSSRPSALPPGQAAPFSPSSYINPASGLTQATPVASRTTSPNVPMTSLPEPPALTAAGAGTGLTADGAVAEDDSPVADFSMDFDWGYTADLLDKVGLSVPEGGDVPLYVSRISRPIPLPR